jgi:hypothetical protein
MKRKNIVFLAGAIMCLLAIFTAIYLYKKPRQTAAVVPTDARIDAQLLYNAFNSNEHEADKRFGNKMLEVTGTVLQVQETGKTFSLLLGNDGAANGVNCSITDSTATAPVQGQKVKVKGRCTGYLIDVNLTDATLLTEH